ncbi:phage portal protein [Cellulosilyticum sp. I15G10I2]|uniref:phage portal protein n=1 Tax=Cellulosilyticum sp. I15G10I2 TaxID=1892843 RepID=UPI00085BCE20|nr:phage portal protein [Cellulosilyticum sp. I15G10I2]
MKLIEKTIAAIFPQTALKREVARKQLDLINSGYGNHGASYSKKSMKGWLFGGGGPKEDIEDNVQTLRERSRDLYMGGAPIATSAIKTTRTNVVGAGLKLKPSIDYEFLGMTEEEADRWETDVEREFKLWAETPNCDLARINNFYEIQQLAFLSWLMNGDTFALLPFTQRIGMPYDLRVQLIEADRVCDPNFKDFSKDIVGGVECNENGEIVAYHIANFHPLSVSSFKNRSWTRVEAYGEKTGRRNVLHIMESERIGQRRGVPLLAPVIEALKQLGRYTEAELMGAVVSGMFTVFIKTNNPSEPPIGESISEEDRVDDEDSNSLELGNGAIVSLGDGEEIQTANPNRPNTAFDGFVSTICRQIGAALEIPPELLLKQFTASYSASRAALLEAWKMFKMRRTWLANDFCQPIYSEWLTEAVAKGRIYAPGFLTNPLAKQAYCQAEWNGPSPGQLNPTVEAQAAKIRVEEGFSTRQQETVEMNGGDFSRNHRQRVKEEKMRQEIPTMVNVKGGS